MNKIIYSDNDITAMAYDDEGLNIAIAECKELTADSEEIDELRRFSEALAEPIKPVKFCV